MLSSRFINVLQVLIVLAVLLSACTGKKKPVEPLPWIPTDLARATELINEKCPEWVDPESRLDSVLLLEEDLTFYYSLPKKERATFDPIAFKAYVLPEIIDNIRENPRLYMHRDSSVTMVFNYLDRDGDLIIEFVVGPEMYR